MSALEQRLIVLYDQLRLPVYRYLVSLGFRPHDADEVIQDTFLQLYRHLEKARQDENIRGWIFRVAHNIAFNQRKAGSRLLLPLPEEWERLVDASGTAANPEELLLESERLARLHAAMQSLSQQQLQCIRLRAEGFRYREIGGILGVSISTVAESLRRAVNKLARSIHGDR